MKVSFGSKIGWQFPANDGGQVNGLNDPGMETFKNRPLTSLAREVLQNSLDAADEGSKKPVEVHFELLSVSPFNLPGLEDLKSALHACGQYWAEDADTVKAFKKAEQACSERLVRVLKISDYNTTGLMTQSQGKRKSEWHRLTKEVGAPGKSEGKLGSFGIGKHAPFACSELRTVFYGTLDQHGGRAFQGVARLASHCRADKHIAQGIGYWGLKSGNEPKKDFSKLPEFYQRDTTGTDIYITGFVDSPGWEAEITKSVLESFFLAIWERKLQVKIGRTAVNKASMKKLFDDLYAERDPEYFANEYYKVLNSEEAMLYEEPDFMSCGMVQLRLLEGKAFKKRIALFRRSGMKIRDKRFQVPTHYAGILTATGIKLDALLRRTEPPSHDDWVRKRAQSADDARILDKLIGWARERVRQLQISEKGEELDAAGISEFLPDETDDAKAGALEDGEEVEQAPAAELTMRLRTPSRAAVRSEVQAEEDPDTTDSEDPQDGPGGPGGDGPGGDDPQLPSAAGPEPGRRVELESVRGYCAVPREGRYRFLLDPAASEAVWIKVFIVGEVGSEQTRVARYRLDGGPELAAPSGRLIGPLPLVKQQRAMLEVVLAEPIRCSLEVAAYAH